MSRFSKISEPTVPLADKLAQKEEKAKLDKYSRKSRMDGASHWLNLGFDIICCVIVVAVLGTIILDLLLPEKCLWLCKAQRGKLNEFFVDGSVVALVGKTFANILEKRNE